MKDNLVIDTLQLVPFESLGPFHFGMGPKELEEKLGEPYHHNFFGNNELTLYWDNLCFGLVRGSALVPFKLRQITVYCGKEQLEDYDMFDLDIEGIKLLDGYEEYERLCASYHHVRNMEGEFFEQLGIIVSGFRQKSSAREVSVMTREYAKEMGELFEQWPDGDAFS